MGTDVDFYLVKKDENDVYHYVADLDYSNRNYALFGWLANVRNYSDIPNISELTYVKLEHNFEENYLIGSYSIVSCRILRTFDYDQPVEDRRVTVQTGPRSWNGGATCKPGGGKMTTYRDLFDDEWFEIINELTEEDDDLYLLSAFN